QTEGAFGGQLASFWMHCGPLMVDAEKMSKSLGNFRTIRATLAADDAANEQSSYAVNPREAEMLRFFIVRNHYRSSQNYAPDNLFDAQSALDRLYQTLLNVTPAPCEIDWSDPAAQAFSNAMNDDFNSSGAVAVLFELASQTNRTGSSESAGLLRALGGILGLLQQDPAVYFRASTRYQRGSAERVQLADDHIEALVQERTQAKKDRHFERADAIRAQLQQAGVELEDKPGGITNWRRA